MSGISSGIGLISGINTADLIDQLIALESRPIRNLEARVQDIDIRRTAFLALSAQLLAVRNAVANFNKPSFFQRFNSSSTNDSIISATASDTAIPGSTVFRIHSLVSNQSMVSRGFADPDTTPIGVGTISIEVGHGKVNNGTDLGLLNGGAGVRRGVITITDRSGASAEIDLRTALTVSDVLAAINSETGIEVRARVTSLAHVGDDGSVATGDRIIVEDLSGGAGDLIISDRLGGSTAADLGIAGRVSSDRIDGSDLVRLSMDMPLSLLNDGNGIGRMRQGNDLIFSTSYGDFNVGLNGILAFNEDTDLRVLNNGRGVRLGVIRITDRAGASVEVDLTELESPAGVTVRQVHQRIAAAFEESGVAASVTVVNSSFLITDTSEVTGDDESNLIVEDVSGFAAADLGIAGDVDNESIFGRTIYRIATLGDVIRAINFAPGNGALVEASISPDGNGIALRALGFENTVSIAAGLDGNGQPSTAADDLGLLDVTFSTNDPFETRRLIAGLNTVLLGTLNGGAGIGTGVVSLTDSLGQTATIDLSEAETLQDIVDLINGDGTTALTASINAANNGIALRDESEGAGVVGISDVSGSLAADLGIAGTFDLSANRTVNGGNLQLQYISRHTLLSELNGGRGVSLGPFRVTDSNGAVHVVNPANNIETVGEIIDAINFAGGDAFEARINDTGDGIIVVDHADGSQTLTIEDEDNGSIAADLRLVGTADAGDNFIDGSFEIKIEVSAGDTLEDIAAKLRDADDSISAAVINDGSSVRPFSLTITSAVSGRRGALMIDSLGLDLRLDTLTEARDAVVSIGADGSSAGLLVTSSTNQLDGVMEGVTFDLLSASDEEVTVTIEQNLDGIVASINSFVEQYNAVLDAIDQSSSFDGETFERGPLFGDTTVDLVRSRLARVIMRPFEGVDASVSRLFLIGIRLGSGNRLEFDEERFLEVYGRSPQLVEKLFSTKETGFGAVIQETLDELTRDFDGVIARKDELLTDRQELLNNRIESLNILLDAKRARLEAQFIGLESALAALQAQQSAIANFALSF
ncbi:MAG: flagellar filament capping protein FliD [Planctomycetes bacterium]|nr:flagellar filament capping protein FliD [Planctomycetota bacterium]